MNVVVTETGYVGLTTGAGDVFQTRVYMEKWGSF